MSNKTLGLSIVGIIIIAIAVWGILRMNNNEPTTPADNTQPTNMEQASTPEATHVVTMQVKDYGTIKLELYGKDAPKTVENFVGLINKGYFDGLTFHRVAAGFVIQGGDPTGTGSGGESIFGAEFEDELNANTPSYKQGYVKGVLAMANRGPDTNTSQFFIMLETRELPHNYTIFGKVIEGQDIVDKIGQVEVVPGPFGPGDGAPVEKIIIEKATVAAN